MQDQRSSFGFQGGGVDDVGGQAAESFGQQQGLGPVFLQACGPQLMLQPLGDPTLQFQACRPLGSGREGLFRFRHHERDVGAIDRTICGNGAIAIESGQPVADCGEGRIGQEALFTRLQGLGVGGQGLFIEAFAGRVAEGGGLIELGEEVSQPLQRFQTVVGANRVLGGANRLNPLWMERLEEDVCGRGPFFAQPFQLAGAHLPTARRDLQPAV